MRLRECVWRTWYGFLAWYSERRGVDYHCMNWGYDDGRELVPESASAERFSLQLYHRLLEGLPAEGSRLVEVSCGRGGGLAYLFQTRRPATGLGLDFAPRNIVQCRRDFGGVDPRLRFEVGHAERLPLADGSVDLLVNVEASHCYGDVDAFIAEAHRSLRPGGLLAWTDFRPQEDVAPLRAKATAAFDVLHEEEITPNVLRAIEQDASRKRRFIESNSVRPLHGILTEFAAADTGSRMFKRFSSGAERYFLWHLRKPAR
jgi:SAM-dependent methyltransferase